MSYTKTTWVDNTSPAINQDNLNKIENGIYNLHNTALFLENEVLAASDTIDHNVSNYDTLNNKCNSYPSIIDGIAEYVSQVLDSVDEVLEECNTILSTVESAYRTIDSTVAIRQLWIAFRNQKRILGIDYYASLPAYRVSQPVYSDDPSVPICYEYGGILYFNYVDGLPAPDDDWEEEEPILIGG